MNLHTHRITISPNTLDFWHSHVRNILDLNLTEGSYQFHKISGSPLPWLRYTTSRLDSYINKQSLNKPLPWLSLDLRALKQPQQPRHHLTVLPKGRASSFCSPNHRAALRREMSSFPKHNHEDVLTLTAGAFCTRFTDIITI